MIEIPPADDYGRSVDACDGLVLCGGRGKRLGGRDKGLQPLGDSFAAARAVDLLRPFCDRLFVSANRNRERYRQITGVTVLADRHAGFPGPLAALDAAAPAVTAPLLLTLPCDIPLLQGAVPGRLLAALNEREDTDLVYATAAGQRQYLCAALRRECLGLAGEQLRRGEYSVRAWLSRLRVLPLELPSPYAQQLRNFNSSDDWAELD